MTSASIVRAAVPQDELELWRLFRLHHEENALFPLSEPKVQYYLDRVLHAERIPAGDLGPRGVIGTIGPIGALEGAIMLVIGSPWYSETITMDDCMSFVDPAHRQSHHGRTLIGYARNMVDQIRKAHADFKMIVGVVSTKRTAAKVRLYSQMMAPVGAYFMYPPPPEASLAIEPSGIVTMRVPQKVVNRKKYRPHRHERQAMKVGR